MPVALFLLLLFSQSDSIIIAVVESQRNIFKSALCLSATPGGKLFVVDQFQQMLIQVAEKGEIEKKIGGQGWGNYEFDGPTDVSSSFLLDIYVTDYNNRRIQRYDSRLNYVQTIDENSLQSVGRFYPKACALSSLGDLFVVETDGKRILKLNKRFQLEHEFGTYKDGAGALTAPKDIALSRADEIYVLDANRITVYDIFGNYLRAIALPEGDWKSIQVLGETVIAVSPRLIVMFVSDGSERQLLAHASIIGISSDEDFADALLLNGKLIVLTPTTLYRCSLP